MLAKLSLTDFQKHKKKVITFSPTVTTIVGISDIGKSTLIRALRWVCLNEFPGPADELVNWDADKAIVKLWVDGKKITRVKGKENHYRLADKKFTAIRKDVPEEIAALLAVSEENFQAQFDPHFWFMESAGQISRELNRIVDLGIIDRSLANVQTEVRRARATLEVAGDRLQKALAAQRDLKWVREADRLLASLEALRDERTGLGEQADSLAGLVRGCMRARKRVQAYSEATGAAASLEKQAATLETKREQRRELATLVGEASKAKKLTEVEVPDIEPLEAKGKRLDRVRSNRQELKSLLSIITSQEQLACQARAAADEKEKELHELLSGKCPVCGREFH